MLNSKSIVDFFLKLKEGPATYVGHPMVRVTFVILHSDSLRVGQFFHDRIVKMEKSRSSVLFEVFYL